MGEMLTTQSPRIAVDYVESAMAAGATGSADLRELQTDGAFRQFRERLQQLARYPHPKMKRLEQVLLDHFAAAAAAEEAGASRERGALCAWA